MIAQCGGSTLQDLTCQVARSMHIHSVSSTSTMSFSLGSSLFVLEQDPTLFVFVSKLHFPFVETYRAHVRSSVWQPTKLDCQLVETITINNVPRRSPHVRANVFVSINLCCYGSCISLFLPKTTCFLHTFASASWIRYAPGKSPLTVDGVAATEAQGHGTQRYLLQFLPAKLFWAARKPDRLIRKKIPAYRFLHFAEACGICTSLY